MQALPRMNHNNELWSEVNCLFVGNDQEMASVYSVAELRGMATDFKHILLINRLTNGTRHSGKS